MGKINNNALDQIVFETDTDDDLKLQVNGATSLRINANLALGLGNTTSYGTAGQVLTSNGAATTPYWQSLNFAPTSNPTFTGNVSLTALNANGSLGTNGQLLTSNGSAAYWAAPPSGGLSEIDMWALTTNETAGGGGFVPTGFARPSYLTKVGTGMSVASGVFTFPSTGTWLISNYCYSIRSGPNWTFWSISTDSGSTWTDIWSSPSMNTNISYYTAPLTVSNATTTRFRWGAYGTIYSGSSVMFTKLA